MQSVTGVPSLGSRLTHPVQSVVSSFPNGEDLQVPFRILLPLAASGLLARLGLF